MFSWQANYLKGFKWWNNQGVSVQQLDSYSPLWVEAGILVCNAWLVFEGKYQESVRQWAGYVLQRGNPALNLTPQATLEAIVGYPLHKRHTRAEMYELLQFVLKREGCEPQDYHTQFIAVQFEVPLLEVWCLIAGRPAYLDILSR